MPAAAFTCKPSKYKPDPDTLAKSKGGEQPEQPEQGDDEDDDDEEGGEQPEQPEQGHGGAKVAVAGKKDKKGGDDKKESCRDLAARKACIKSDAVCSWCEGKFAPSMCLDEVRRGARPVALGAGGGSAEEVCMCV
jgi:hypothetical protein